MPLWICSQFFDKWLCMVFTGLEPDTYLTYFAGFYFFGLLYVDLDK